MKVEPSARAVLRQELQDPDEDPRTGKLQGGGGARDLSCQVVLLAPVPGHSLLTQGRGHSLSPGGPYFPRERETPGQDFKNCFSNLRGEFFPWEFIGILEEPVGFSPCTGHHFSGFKKVLV